MKREDAYARKSVMEMEGDGKRGEDDLREGIRMEWMAAE